MATALATGKVRAQSVVVETIELHGNTHTHDKIILRELDFEPGDSIPIQDLAETLEHNRNQLLNLGLFNEVELTVHEWNVEKARVLIWVEVHEAWAIYPIPVVELADRNFNVWWEEHDGSLSRLNLGLRLKHINLTGHNDKLKVLAQLGYTPKFEFEYDLPFFNRNQTFGFNVKFSRSVNKEMSYRTLDNKLQFVSRDNQKLLKNNSFRLSLYHRPDLYWHHELGAAFKLNATDSIIGKELNPDYFGNARLHQRFLSLEYTLTYDKRNIKIYPTVGLYWSLSLEKKGFGLFDDINTLEFYPAIENFFSFNYRWSLGGLMKGKISLIRNKIPYSQYNGLGYGVDFVRGYELYVIDGLDYFYGKYSLKFLVIERLLNWGDWIPLEPLRLMPWKLYLSANFDIGYVNDPFYPEGNAFTNRWINGWGPSATLMVYNNVAIHLQYSINHTGEKGIFLHNKLSF